MSKENKSSNKPTSQKINNIQISEKRSKDVPVANYDRPKPPVKQSGK